MKITHYSVFTLLLFFLVSTKAHSQLEDLALKMLNSGEVVYTTEFNTKPKRKEVAEAKVFTPEQAIYATIYLKRAINKTGNVRQEENRSYLRINLQVEGQEEGSIEVDIKTSEAGEKFFCFLLAPDQLDMNNVNHQILVNLFGNLKPAQYTVKMSVGDGNISGKFQIDFSKGTGKYGEITKKLEEKRKKEEEETRLRAEVEEKKRQEAVKAFESAADAVKVTFKNICQNEGILQIETGNNLTNFSVRLAYNQTSQALTCRLGNKVYLDGKLIHTISAASKAKPIEFCPPKTQKQIDEEKFEQGMQSIQVSLANRCGNAVNYTIEQGGSSTQSMMNSNSSMSIYGLNKGHKIWLCDENRNKIRMVFEATSYSQNNTEVILCN